MVGRYDFSKATRIAYEAHPDWFVHNVQGAPLEYHGTYQACVNGDWYSDYAERILEELAGGSRSPVPANVEHEIRGWMGGENG